MPSTALKADSQVFQYPINWIPKEFLWNNFVEVWTKVPFGLYYFNTIKLSVIITAGQGLFSAMAAYAFANRKYLRPVGNDLQYALQFRIRTLFHTICVEEYLKPALRNLPSEQLPNLSRSFSFDNCAYWEEIAGLIQQYTKNP